MVYQLPVQTYFDQKDMIDCTYKNADDWGVVYFFFTLYPLANVYITVENHIFFMGKLTMSMHQKVTGPFAAQWQNRSDPGSRSFFSQKAVGSSERLTRWWSPAAIHGL